MKITNFIVIICIFLITQEVRTLRFDHYMRLSCITKPQVEVRFGIKFQSQQDSNMHEIINMSLFLKLQRQIRIENNFYKTTCFGFHFKVVGFQGTVYPLANSKFCGGQTINSIEFWKLHNIFSISFLFSSKFLTHIFCISISCYTVLTTKWLIFSKFLIFCWKIAKYETQWKYWQYCTK